MLHVGQIKLVIIVFLNYYCYYYYYYYYYLKKGWQFKAGRAINTLSVRRSQPHSNNPWNERRERENSGDKK